MCRKYITYLLVTILSLQLKAQPAGSSSTLELDIPNSHNVYEINAIGGERVETYKNSSNKYFYNPLIIVDWNHFKKQLDSCANQDDSSSKKLLLLIYHFDKKVHNELKMHLEREANTSNIKLVYLPFTYYILKARIGNEYVILNPTDLPTFSNIGNLQIKQTIENVRNYEIKGSLKQLKEFYNFRASNDNLKGDLYTGGFEFSSDYVKGTAEFANSSNIMKKLFGDETLKHNQVVSSSSSDGGLSLSLGPLKLGGGTVKSAVWTENEKKRILNRNYLTELITNNQTEIRVLSMGDKDRVRATKEAIIKYLLETVAIQVTLEFQKVRDDEYNLVKDNITYATLKSNQVDILLQSKPKLEVSTEDQRSASSGGASGASKDNITRKSSDEITWQYKGDEWVPTKVEMYILSEYQLTNSISIEDRSYNKGGNKVIRVAFTYPAAWLAKNPQALSRDIVDRDNPIGTILAFAGNSDKIPAGWRLCNGDTLLVQGNEEIYNVIGDNWGKSPNGYFRLPDLRGVFLRGVNFKSDKDPDRVKNKTENIVGNYQEDAFLQHDHNFQIGRHYSNAKGGDNRAYVGADWGQRRKTASANSTKISDHETRPKNVTVNYIIRCE